MTIDKITDEGYDNDDDDDNDDDNDPMCIYSVPLVKNSLLIADICNKLVPVLIDSGADVSIADLGIIDKVDLTSFGFQCVPSDRSSLCAADKKEILVSKMIELS